MAVSIDLIKQLRESTHAPLGDCKKTLEETNGNIEEAKVLLRERGISKASKKGDRETNNGVVKFSSQNGFVAGIIVLCETDFVAKNEKFLALVDAVLAEVLQEKGEFEDASSKPELMARLQMMLDEQVATVGERLVLSMIYKKESQGYVYNHTGNTLSAFVLYEGGSESAAKEVAMQVAAMNPQYLSLADVPQALMDEQRQKFLDEMAADSSKPEDIKQKIVAGKIHKYFQDEVLLDQVSIKDPTKSIKDVVGDMKIHSFHRFTVS